MKQNGNIKNGKNGKNGLTTNNASVSNEESFVKETDKAIVAMIERSQETISTMIERSHATISSMIEKSQETINSKISSMIERSNETIGSMIEKSQETTTSKISAMIERSNETIGSMIEKSQETIKAMTERSQETIKAMTERSHETINAMTERSQKTINSIIARDEKSHTERIEANKEFDKKLEKMSEMFGGIGNNNGAVAEEFFYNGLCESMVIGDLQFDSISLNVKHPIRKGQQLQDEFDMILTGPSYLAIVEVKCRVYPNDVKKFLEKKLPNFRLLFPEKADYDIYGVVAGLSIPEDARKLAKDAGLFVLAQSGKNIKLINDKVKPY